MANLIGKGPAFPFKRGDDGNWKMAEGEELLKGALIQLARTDLSERPMFKNFGTIIKRLLFMTTGENQKTLAKSEIQEAYWKWERRVTVTNVSMESKDTHLHLTISYYNKDINDERNIVVPYNLGTGEIDI